MPDKVKTKPAWDYESNSPKRGDMMSDEKNSDVKTRPHCPPDLKTLKDRYGIDLKNPFKAALTTENTNVFTDPSYTPSNIAASIREQSSRLLNIAFNQTLKAGDTIKLAIDSVSGVEQSAIKAVTGDQVLGFDSGSLTLILYNRRVIAGLAIKDPSTGQYKFVDDAGKTLEFNSPGVLTLDDSTQITFQNQTSADALDGSFGLQLYEETIAPANFDLLQSGAANDPNYCLNRWAA